MCNVGLTSLGKVFDDEGSMIPWDRQLFQQHIPRARQAYEHLTDSLTIKMLESASDNLPTLTYVTSGILQEGSQVWQLKLTDSELQRRWEPGTLQSVLGKALRLSDQMFLVEAPHQPLHADSALQCLFTKKSKQNVTKKSKVKVLGRVESFRGC